MKTPTAAVAARRRRTLLWLPMLALGAVLFLLGMHDTVTINGAGLVGMLLLVAGAAGFVAEVDR
jgi:hypothetical protein